MKTVGTVKREVNGVSKEQIYAIWADVNNWHKFNHGIEYAKLNGEFKTGNSFILGLPGGKKVTIKLQEVVENQSFTDVTVFPLAKMYGIHDIKEKNGKLELTATIQIEGILSFLWERVVARDVAKKLGDDMDALIKLAKNEL